MDKIKKVYIDSRYKSNDSVSNSDFKFELKEALDLPDNTVCYIDDISIPHTWYTIEDYNNKLYIEGTNPDLSLSASILTVKNGNYTASSLSSTLNSILQTRFPNDNFSCIYNVSVGTITISSTMNFRIMTDEMAKSLQGNIAGWYGNNNEEIGQPDYNNLQSINEVLRYSILAVPDTTFESGFVDLLNVHNIYIHSSNLGHFNSIGVRGENTIIKKVPVSSSFGYLIMDSVVAPHDKIDVSRQLIKTLNFTLKNVHGNTINLHGAHISFSLIFQSIE